MRSERREFASLGTLTCAEVAFHAPSVRTQRIGVEVQQAEL
jgi:hypothetical protein